MDFIRKNWSRLSLAFIYLVGAVIAVVAWVNNWNVITDNKGIEKFFYLSVFISTIVFFLGMITVNIVKAVSSSKKTVSAIYMVVGGLITVLLVVFIIVAGCQQYSAVLFTGSGALESLYLLWVPFFIFGLYPLVKGTTRFIEGATFPVKAEAAQPVAKPAAETPAEAPKVPAKKTATATKAKTTKAAK